MSAATALARGRAAAEALMVDTCTIQRTTGTATDPHTGEITPTQAVIYSGACKVQQPDTQATEQKPGQAELLMVRRELHLPIVTSDGVRADDEVTIDTSVHDADLVGRLFAVRGEMSKSMSTARRLGVEEVTS